MSIIRAPRPTEKFYVLDKRISEDKRLSWAARGLLVYLLGKPDHWKVSVSALISETEGSVKQTRRDGIYSLIRELEVAGYLSRSQDRGVGGTFDKGTLTVSELPHPPGQNVGSADIPSTAKPSTAKPSTAETTLVNTDLQANTETQQGLIRVPAGEKIRPPPAAKNGTAVANKPTGSNAWAAYASAYLARYHTGPVRNAKVNGQFAHLAKRLPENEIEHVVRWYVASNAALYVRSKHCVDLLLRDCEGLRTEWATGARMTDTEARQIDQHDAGAEAARWVTENMEQLRQARREGKI